MADIYQFNLNTQQYLAIAKNAIGCDDLDTAVLVLRKIREKDPQNAEACLLYGGVFQLLGEYETALKIYFDCYDRENEQLICGIIECLSAINEIDDLQKYLWLTGVLPEDFQTDDKPEDADNAIVFEIPAFRVATANDDGEVLKRLSVAREHFLSGDDKAGREVLQSIDVEDGILGNFVLSSRISAALAAGDFDQIIAEEDRILSSEKYDGNLSILLTAYAMQERFEDLLVLLRRILQNAPEINEDLVQSICMLLPSERINKIVLECADIILKRFPYRRFGLYLKSQALFNLGRTEEARNVMLYTRSFYGEFCDADEYLELYDRCVLDAEPVPYDLWEPVTIRDELMAQTEANLNKLSRQKLSETQKQLKNGELKTLMYQALRTNDEAVTTKTLAMLKKLRLPIARELLLEAMTDLSVDKYTRIDSALSVLTGWGELKAPLMINYYRADLSLYLPNNYTAMPPIFQSAYNECLRHVFLNSRAINQFAGKLERVFDSLAEKCGDTLEWSDFVDVRKAKRLRSPAILAAVLYYVSSEYKVDADTVCDEFWIPKRTFKKYLSLVFDI